MDARPFTGDDAAGICNRDSKFGPEIFGRATAENPTQNRHPAYKLGGSHNLGGLSLLVTSISARCGGRIRELRARDRTHQGVDGRLGRDDHRKRTRVDINGRRQSGV